MALRVCSRYRTGGGKRFPVEIGPLLPTVLGEADAPLLTQRLCLSCHGQSQRAQQGPSRAPRQASPALACFLDPNQLLMAQSLRFLFCNPQANSPPQYRLQVTSGNRARPPKRCELSQCQSTPLQVEQNMAVLICCATGSRNPCSDIGLS